MDYQFVLQELTKYWTQKIHASIFPESSLVVEDFMTHYVSNCRQLFVGAAFLEADEILDNFMSLREVFRCDISLSPKFDFIGRVHLLGFFIQIVFERRHLVPKPDLMNLSGDQVRATFIVN